MDFADSPSARVGGLLAVVAAKWKNPGSGQDNLTPHYGKPPDGPLPALNPKPIAPESDGVPPFI